MGPGTAFDAREGLPASRITDGLASTLLIAEAADSVPWTRPSDLVVKPEGPLPRLGSLPTGRVSLLFADGTVSSVPGTRLGSERLRALITPAGGETIDRSIFSP